MDNFPINGLYKKEVLLMHTSRKHLTFIFLLALSVILISAVFYWLKSPYPFNHQRHIATRFINHINQQEFEQAFELTQKNIYTGKTLETFKNKALSEIRGSEYKFDYSYPRQTNGNRLRRWFNNSEIEMHDVSLEFKGPSDLRITLQHTANDEWKINYITSHAG